MQSFRVGSDEGDRGTSARALRIALVAEEGAGLRALKALERTPHRISMVLTSPPDSPRSVIWKYADEKGHRLVPAAIVKDAAFAETLRREQIDLLLNVHSLHVIAAPIVEAPRIGSFNLHPGPLPRYAGLNAPSWALLRGEPRHGVTLHRMSAGIDTGPIAYQTLFDIGPRDTAVSVALRCIEEGGLLLARLVEAAATNPAAIPCIEQDLARREYFGRQVPEGGVVAWDRPASAIDRFVRAFCYHPFPSPWGHPATNRGALVLGIVAVTPTGQAASAPPGAVAVDERGVRVASLDEWLALDVVAIDGEVVAPASVLRDGDRLGSPAEPLALGGAPSAVDSLAEPPAPAEAPTLPAPLYIAPGGNGLVEPPPLSDPLSLEAPASVEAPVASEHPG